MESLGIHLLELYRRKAWDSLYFFCKYVLGYKDMRPQPHWELCDFILQYGDSDCLILLPRGTFKSTVITVGWVLWKLWHNPNLRFLITGAELANSKKFLSVIKDHTEKNEIFRAVCGRWDEKKGKETWHSEAIHIAPRTDIGTAQDSVTCASSSTTKVAQHYDYAIVDDLVTDKTVTTRDQVEKANDYLNLLLPILDPQPGKSDPGPRILLGTRWRHNDPYGKIIARDRLLNKDGRKSRYRKLIRKAHSPKWDWIYFPSRFSRTYLETLRIESGLTPYAFSCQYLNDPMADGDQPFKRSSLKFYHESDLPRALTTFLLCDPAIGLTDRCNFTALVTVSIDVDSVWYIREVTSKRVLPNEAIDLLWKAAERYQPHRIGIEAVLFQKMLAMAFRDEQLRRGRRMNITELKPETHKSKDMRIMALQPYFEAGLIRFPVDKRIALNQSKELQANTVVHGTDVLIDQLLEFPLGEDRDVIDALAYTLYLAYPARVRAGVPQRENTFRSLREMATRARRELY